MSTADHSSQAGFTLLEVVFVVAILAGIALVLTAVLRTAGHAAGYLEAVRKTARTEQRVMNEIVAQVSSSHKIFENDVDGVGPGYLAALALGERPLLDGARLPRIDVENPLGPDVKGDPMTGNVLLFASESTSATCVVDASTKKLRAVDTYRFVCVYPTQTTKRMGRDRQPARDLVVWRSIGYPSYAQIMAIADDAERASAVRDLYTRYGYRHAWNPQVSAGEAFYDLDARGDVAALPSVWFKIEEDPTLSDRGRLVHETTELAPTRAGDANRRAIYTADDPALWQPEGFEIKVAGAVATRQVWLHLTIEAFAPQSGDVAVQPGTMVVNVRDL